MMKNTEKVMRSFVIGEDVRNKVEYCSFGIIETPITKNETATKITPKATPVCFGGILGSMAQNGITIVKE